MEISNWIGIAAIVTTLLVVIWKEYKDKKNKKEQSFLNLAITYHASFKFGIAEIGRQLRDSDAYGLEISIAIHNIGNANAVVSRIFVTEQLKDGNYKYLEEFKFDIESQRIIKAGESFTYHFQIEGNHIQKLDVQLSNKSAFIRVLEASGKIFDSPRK